MTASKYEIFLMDPNGNRLKTLDRKASAWWEYNRQGGCGQAQVEVTTNDDTFVDSILPNCSIKILIGAQVRYWGKIIKISKITQSGVDKIILLTYGYSLDLATLIVRKTYTSSGIKAIIQDILDTYVTPYSPITYSASNIDDPGYALGSLVLNHTVKDALTLLQGIAGNFEWSVDSARSFYFKAAFTELRASHVFVLGKDVMDYQEERNDEHVINVLNVFGAEGAYLLTLSVTDSITTFGQRQDNLFESSISSAADAVRLASASLALTSGFSRSLKMTALREDIFLESTIPVGAICLTLKKIDYLTLYGNYKKYGQNFKYGNLKRDQLQNVRYQIADGGMTATMTLQDDIPNLGALQQRYQYEIRDLQRR